MTTTPGEIPIPAALTATVQRWQDQGKPEQPPIRWSRDPWRRHFPSHHAFLDALPERIDRAEATLHAAHAVTSEGAERAFLAAMIWGYGRVGYGPWRTSRVLTENPDALDRLAKVAAVARDQGGLAAFRDLAGEPLRYLEVAFGTKYLRFVTAAQSQDSAPILDAVVRRWVATHTGVRLLIDGWRPEVYETYVGLLTSWSAQLELSVDTVEELIFRSAVSREGPGQWSESWAGSDDSVSPEQRAHAALLELERLFDTAEAEAAQEARQHLDALEGIIRQGWAH
ncbi:hypothetical protein [Amycolatopsis circi]|uniref:8-oxoguanine DNA glycosylase OGG fold protein n=1 Tax=Amycolatopsis circi TaxID=871959 RepID=UPI0013BEA5E3|nr:hypothetical protein [Amycolatopsis circi]